MAHYPPENSKEWIKVLKKLGFVEKRVGKGKHAHKFSHRSKKTRDYRIQRNFIVIPHNIYPTLSAQIVKQVLMFGDISLEEIQQACR